MQMQIILYMIHTEEISFFTQINEPMEEKDMPACIIKQVNCKEKTELTIKYSRKIRMRRANFSVLVICTE